MIFQNNFYGLVPIATAMALLFQPIFRRLIVAVYMTYRPGHKYLDWGVAYRASY